MPQWSPDGKTLHSRAIADLGKPISKFLRIGKWKISLYDVATGDITVVPGQGGLNINPQWGARWKSLAYVSDRTGIANLFLYDLTDSNTTN